MKAPTIGGETYSTPTIKNPMGENFGDSEISESVRAYVDEQIANHRHDGFGSTRSDIGDVFGLLETVSVAPIGTPNDLYDQIKIFKSGATHRLYWYEGATNTWHYATGT